MRKASRIEFCFGLVKFEMLFRSSGTILKSGAQWGDARGGGMNFERYLSINGV